MLLMSDTRDPETYAVIGAAMEVHNRLGHGFLEAVYNAALGIELTRSNIPFERERALAITYRDAVLPCVFRADLVCFDGLLVELKANVVLGKADEAQIVNYLKASGLKKGLLLNFGSEQLQYKRFVF
jgi:GxxExxY protein